MISLQEVNITTILTWMLGVLVVFLVFKYNWERRWLYFYGSQFDGPFTWPLLGKIKLIRGGYEGFFDNFVEIVNENSSIFRFWLGGELFIINSEPEDVEILLKTFLEKSPYYHKFPREFLFDGILTAPVSIWKKHRKLMNPFFNQQLLNSYVGIFAKYANRLVDDVKENCDKGPTTILTTIWRANLNIALETLANVDSDLISGQDEYVSAIIRLEELMTSRIFKVWLHPDFIWKSSSLGKEMGALSSKTLDFARKVIDIKKSQLPEQIPNDKTKQDNGKKRFLNHFIEINRQNEEELSDRNVLEETQTMIITGSETSTLTLGFILLVLGVRKDVQDKVYEEIHSIFGDSTRDVALEDISRMRYLDRVIKETMRFYPPIPIITRTIDQDIKVGRYVYPKGCSLIVPISYINTKPELWEDSPTFNPDRFLPEENKKRHRCAYIPFSYGTRNCIAGKYGMMSMKTILATFLRHYEVESVNYKSVADIKVLYTILSKPKDDCELLLKRRK